MNRYPFTMSQRQIWMNEKAFPKEAINTIGIRLKLSTYPAESLCCAVDKVIDACDVFGLQIDQERGEGLYLPEEVSWRQHCILLPPKSKTEMEQFCEEAESNPLPKGSLYRAVVFPLSEGGALLSFLFHHILVDGYSMCQITQLVLDALEGKEIAKLPLPKAASEESETLDVPAERKYWLEYFQDLQAENRIFGGEEKGLRRFRCRHSLSPAFSKQLDSYAKAQGLSTAALFSAALSLYLARAAQTADAVFVMPRLNRDTEELRRQIACRTLVVPVRVQVQEDMTWLELCHLAQTQARKASAHKQYGYGHILSDLHESGLITEGLSQYTLNFYQPRLEASFPFSVQLSMDGAMHNHLTANITRLQGSYEICYDGREGIYTPETVKFFHQALLRILEQGLTMEGPVSEFCIVGQEEEEQLLHQEGKSVAISDSDTIPSLFVRAAKRYPERPALYAGSSSYTFRELDLLSNRVANALLSHGVKSAEPVLFMLHRDHRVLPVLLGILKAGAAFVPVDPQYPKNRVDYMLENSQAAFFISTQELLNDRNLDKNEGQTLLEADELLAFPKDTAPSVSISQEQLAYCIYTSGTTGRPKGVMLSHRGIVNITHPDNNPFNRDICRCGRGIVAIGSVCFDISLFEIFVPLFNGMFVEFAADDALADPVKIANLLTAHGANLLHCTPSRLSVYLKEPHFSAALRQVEAILSAGEVLAGSLVDELKNNYGVRIYNGYGPTEITIGATITEAGDNQSIGRPIANTGVMILDTKGRLVPRGTVGELCVYGKGVGIGYYGLPEQTAKRFVTRFQRRMYCSGDLGLFLPDGRILYKGRNDHQVKLRGLRIELPEIENQMRAFSGVGEAQVLVRILAGSQHLVGFYTVRPNETVKEDALKNHLKERLTSYMVPDVFKELPSMPQTPVGKVDLRALEQEAVEYVRTYRAPETNWQKQICAAFSAVLEEETIGLDDNFFELGGDSLHIAELVSAIEERLPEVSPEFADIFRYPTPELLAQYLYHQISATKKSVNLLGELDYSGIDELLSAPCSDEALRRPLGNVLLTGVTGFLGIHILMELLKQPQMWTRIFCLVRPTERLSAQKRLRNTLFYYGEDDCASLLGEKLFAVEGELKDAKALSLALKEASIQTVINCAASVAHFAYDDKLERTNVGGVKNLLSLCKQWDAALIQISTISVAGISPAGSEPQTLTEQQLYIGQEIQNQYILSKYMAEYEILKAATQENITVKIMRVGNLQGRLADGEFQMNSRTNAFTRRLASYIKIGKVPRSLYEGSVNFSPIDEVARMITILAGLPKCYPIFHVYPPKEIPYSQLFDALAAIGRPVDIMEDEAFAQLLEELGKTKQGKALLEGILLEHSDVHDSENSVTADRTEQVLTHLGEQWGAITNDYLNRYVTVLEEYQIFGEEG
ncbi:MAG: amino acid adenylation domain-containing protein [bacterium]|nr:amino acid adenylation domain-containing protein [bacterium]